MLFTLPLMNTKQLQRVFGNGRFHLSLQELLCRSALETQKLELMSEVSNLKLKLNTMEKDRLDFDRFRDSEVNQSSLCLSACFLSLSLVHKCNNNTDLCCLTLQ